MRTNLAKMLGIEEMHTPPPSPAPLSDTVIVQQQIHDVSQAIEDTAAATDVALESIGCAMRIQSIIRNNDSSDPTCYLVAKAALENLKERTGVYTSAVALEDISPLSYKMEAMSDIKKFATKVWEAIKKAFTAMRDKIKAFFGWIFNKQKAAEKQAEKVQEEVEEFVKEFKKAPTSEKEAEKYTSDYFNIKDGYFNKQNTDSTLKLGHTPGVTNSVKSGGFNTGEKQPEYSGNFNKSDKYFREQYVTRHNKNTISYLGVPANEGYFRPSEITHLLEKFDSMVTSIGSFISGIPEIRFYHEDEVDNISSYIIRAWHNERPIKTPLAGHTEIDLKLKHIKNEAGLSSDINVRKFEIEFKRKYTPEEVYPDEFNIDEPVKYDLWEMGKTLDSFKKTFDKVTNIHRDLESASKKISDFFQANSDLAEMGGKFAAEEFRESFDRRFAMISSSIDVVAKISSFILGLYKAVIDYCRETISYMKVAHAHFLKSHGYIARIAEFEKVTGFSL